MVNDTIVNARNFSDRLCNEVILWSNKVTVYSCLIGSIIVPEDLYEVKPYGMVFVFYL